MPKPARPLRDKPAAASLYQVNVELTANGRVIPVGPRLEQQTAEQFCAAINVQIVHGKEKRWANPHVVPVTMLT